MKQGIASWGRARRAAVVALSLVGHGLLLVVLGMAATSLPTVRTSEPTLVPLDLWPLSRTPVRRSPRPENRSVVSPLSPRRARVIDPAGLPPDLRSPVQALPAAPATAATTDLRATPLPAPAGGDLRGALRGSTVGCANRDTVGLTRREREGCDDRYARGRENDPFIAPPIEPGKRAAWDAEAARKERIRKRKEAPPPQGVNPSDNAGGTRTNGLGILGY